MKTHKRKKTSRIRGSRTFGYGFRQNHKGHGNKGGFGMAGAGKRADHRRQLARDIAKKAGAKSYFGKQGFTSKGTAKKKYDKINLKDIKLNYSGSKIDLSGYKILGDGDGFKAEIKAKSATKSAIEKMEKAGGKIIVSEKAKIVVEKVAEEKKVTEDKAKKTPVKKPVVKKKKEQESL